MIEDKRGEKPRYKRKKKENREKKGWKNRKIGTTA